MLDDDTETQQQFATTGTIPGGDITDMPRVVDNRPPTTAAAWVADLGVIAYDDIFAVE